MWETDKLWPVTVTCVVNAEVKLQFRLALPEPVMVVGERVQAVLLVVKLTMPEKPFTAMIVIVNDEAVPTLRTTLVGLVLTM